MLATDQNTFDACGVNVIARGDFNYDEVAARIANSLKYLISADQQQTTLIRSRAINLASLAAWSYFIEYYVDAFRIALDSARMRATEG